MSKSHAPTAQHKYPEAALVRKIKKKTPTISPPANDSNRYGQISSNPYSHISQNSQHQPSYRQQFQQNLPAYKSTQLAPPPIQNLASRSSLLQTLQTQTKPQPAPQLPQMSQMGYYNHPQIPMQGMYNPYINYDPNAQMYNPSYMNYQAMSQQGRMPNIAPGMMYGQGAMLPDGTSAQNYEALMSQAMFQQQQYYAFEQMMAQNQASFMMGKPSGPSENPNSKQ